MTTATIEQPTAMPVQQTATPVQQKATPSHQAANPRFNYRIMAGFDDRQAENIRVLQKKMGGATESALMRTAVDLLCFVHVLMWIRTLRFFCVITSSCLKEAPMASNLSDQAYQIAVDNAEQQLVECTRSFEDSQRAGDAHGMAYAYEGMTAAKANLDRITGADQPQQPGLSAAQEQYLNRLRSLGDDVDSPAARQTLAAGHMKAIAAGWPENSAGYFAAIDGFRNSQGDGKQETLTERSAAQLCGIDDQTYAQNAQKLRWLKSHGYYQE